MSVRLGLLGLLKEAPSHGYALKLRYDDLLDPDRPVQPAQIYSTLTRLERDGLVELLDVAKVRTPTKRVYQATANGVDELERWLSTPVEPEPHLHTVLYVKVVLTLLTGLSVEEFLDSQREAHLVRMRELTILRQSNDTAMSLLADYALFHLESDLRWLDLTAARAGELVEHLTRRAR